MLYLIPTPIGNLQDITIRALKIIFSVDIILAEDTRRTGNLLDYYRKQLNLLSPFLENLEQQHQQLIYHPEQKPQYISFHEFNENKKIDTIIQHLKNKKEIALVSDAGTPLISDPGYKLVRECLNQQIKVISLPGPNAAITALVGSGQPPNRYLYLGYLSPKEKRRQKELQQIKNAVQLLKKPPTIIIYESPHRLLSTLNSILQVSGDIDLTLASELTKLHEKNITQKISIWIEELNKRKHIKGEYTVLFRF